MTSSRLNSFRARRESYWSERSDAELINYEFQTADPEKLDNLLQSVPDTDEIPEVEFAYDTSATGTGMVRCIHCKKVAKNHYRGFVLRFSDGRRMLFGRNCGEKIYGAEFGLNEREFQRALKRSDLLKRRQGILDRRKRTIELLELIEADPAWKTFSNLKRQFVAAFPDLAAEFAEAAGRRDGVLYADVQVPDRQAEARYEQRTGRKATFFMHARAAVHVLTGRDFYAPKDLPDIVVPDLVRRAKNTLWTIGDGDKSDRDLELTFKGLANIVTALRELAVRLDHARLVFTPGNVEGISKWLQSVSLAKGELRLDGARLSRCSKKGVVREFLPRDDSPWPRRAEMLLPDAMPTAPVALINEVELSLR